MSSPIKSAENAVRQLSSKGRRDPKVATELVKYLEGILPLVSPSERYLVYLMLLGEHGDHRRFVEAELVISTMAHECPDEPQMWIEVANYYLYVVDNAQKALFAARRGVEEAKRAEIFVIHALNTQCRVASATKDYELLETSIADLVSYQKKPNSPDSAYECDFIYDIPKDSIEGDLISSLKDLCH